MKLDGSDAYVDGYIGRTFFDCIMEGGFELSSSLEFFHEHGQPMFHVLTALK